MMLSTGKGLTCRPIFMQLTDNQRAMSCRDFLVLDDDVHIAVGNRGSYGAVRPK